MHNKRMGLYEILPEKDTGLWRLCVMCLRGPNNVGRAVQTDPTLLRFDSAITEQKKFWELLA